jgi:probable phosphoglycerate mutase
VAVYDGRVPSRPKHPTFSTILLVRHGTTPSTGKILPGRAPDLHLSERGIAQAKTAAERIGELNTAPTQIYASPLERTRETAQPIARALGIRTRVNKGLLECDFGTWTGERLDRLMKKKEWAQVQRSPSTFRFPSGESFSEMATRTYDTVVDLASRHRGETIVLVSHADPIKAVISTAIGSPLDLFQRITISPCSVSALLFSDAGPHVLAVNTTGSLKELALS